jgi:integrase
MTTPNRSRFWKRYSDRTDVDEKVTPHCYRHAWAEDAAETGYPERWAKAYMGQGSSIVHNVNAKAASLTIPPLSVYKKDRGNVIKAERKAA